VCIADIEAVNRHARPSLIVSFDNGDIETDVLWKLWEKQDEWQYSYNDQGEYACDDIVKELKKLCVNKKEKNKE
jgi:hypothetical protein